MCFPGSESVEKWVSQLGEHISLGIRACQVGEHMPLGICVSQVGEYILLGICVFQVGMCLPGGGTHISRDVFPRLGTHVTRDMCFPGRDVFARWGNTYF